MNIVTISGMLGKDPQVFDMSGGVRKAELSVANKIWTKAGVKTVWIQVRVIGKRADAAAANLRKGDKVWVQGSWQADEWQDKVTKQKRRLDYLFASSIEWSGSVTRDEQQDMSRDMSRDGPDDDAY